MLVQVVLPEILEILVSRELVVQLEVLVMPEPME
jgi:hypothetical protein